VNSPEVVKSGFLLRKKPLGIGGFGLQLFAKFYKPPAARAITLAGR
jgi:hypothetical protein